MNRFSPNNFQKGMNKDFDERIVQPATYRDSVNFALTNEGEFFSLTKIGSSGSRMEFGVPSSRGNVISFDLLGSKECYLPNEVEAVVLFTRMETTNGTYFNIYTVDLSSNTVYNTAEGDFLNFGEVEYVDSVIDRDNGKDYVYFLDGVNEPRKISVESGESRYTNRFQISNQRFGALDPVEELEEEFGGGSLLGGSYQVGYKLVNTIDGTESKPSLFSNPINVVGTDKEDPTKIYGLVPNEQSSSSLKFKINLGFGYDLGLPNRFVDQDETDKKNLYNAIQLLIIKTTDGAKVQSTIVDKLAPNKQFYERSIRNTYIEYLGNEEASTERLEELSVDDAAIATAKTITLKEGNIFYGGVKYRDLKIGENEGLAFNSVTITKDIGIPSSTINKEGEPQTLEYGDKGYKKASNTCKYKSEKRGEVIRYGIAYADEFGNWSDPKPQDFSGDSALTINPAYQAQVPSGGIEYDPKRGQLKIVDETLYSLSEIGDFINIYLSPVVNPSEIELIPCLITDTVFNDTVFVDFDDSNFRNFTLTGLVDLLGSSEKNNSNTVDWKYPSRNNPNFTILNNINNQPSISAMGLKIGSIDRHPEWAKAYAIVRVQREKNILTQGVVLPTKAIMPSIGSGDDFEPTANANPDGSYIAKTLSKGGNSNVFRVLERQDELGNNFCDEAASNNVEGFDQQEVSKIFKIMSPDYMASNISNDEIYDDSWLNVVKEFNVVDAISTFGTDNIGFRSNEVDSGLNAGDQQGRAFDAGDSYSQYSVRGRGGINLNGLRDEENPITKAEPNLILGRERGIVGTYPKVNSQLQTLLPSNPLKGNEFFKITSTVGGIWEVGEQNGGLLEGSAEQKGVYVVSDGYFGDLSYLSCFEPVEVPQRQRWFPYIDFSRVNQNPFYRVKASTLGVGFNTIGVAQTAAWNNAAENEITSSYGVLSIVELSKGLGDDRYGDINKEQNFFNTGTTGRIVSPTTPLSNIEIFGGDTFISKCYYKVNSSSYGLFKKDSTSPPTNGEPIALKTYKDWHEILGVYLESDVNFDLQADKYTYPVENALNGVDFKRDYAYPYNFSYSIKNLAKVWRNFALDSREQTDFGNRIVYTDKHITNSLDNSYKIVRVANFYDLDGVYGDIESLNRLTNEVYALQRNAVCYIPIGKRSIEDGSGSSLVINTTDTITTPIYLSVTNGCQDISTVKVSKKTMSWLDRNRREVLSFSKESGIMNISDKGMYSYFQSLGENSSVWAWNDLDREEYGITIGDGYELVYSEKIGAWTSRLYTNGIRLFSAKDSIYAIDKVGTDIFLDRMYDGDGYGKILETSIEPSIEFIVNQDSIIPKVFDVIRVDSTNKFDKGRMIVNGEDNIVLDTDIHDLPIKQSRQGGYEIYTIRDVATGQRLRGKAMIVKLIDSEIFNNHISVNSVLTKYRESPNAFIKRYKK